MAQHPLTLSQQQDALDALVRYGSHRAAAAALGMPRSTFQHRVHAALSAGLEAGGTPEKPQPEFTIAPLPPDGLTAEELVAQRIAHFQRKAAYEEARKLLTVQVAIDGPIGIWHFGDPHLDDDGTDLAALQQHSDLVRTVPGLFGANVGDTTNNWVGQIGRAHV